MTALAGLDLNATRLRAVAGPPGAFAAPVFLEAPQHVLPLCISLANGKPEVGQAALRLCRRSPHLFYSGFLPTLGQEEDSGRRWFHARQRPSSNQALGLAFQQVGPALDRSTGLVLALPDYLTPAQVPAVFTLAEKARLPVLGSLPTSLACALAAASEQAWSEACLVVDIDEHALILSTIQEAGGEAHLLDSAVLPHLGFGLWKDRLLNGLADRCIVQSRRDPRSSAVAEQSLFDQLDGILDACKQGWLVNVVFHADQWYQNLMLQPEDTIGFCAPLVRQVRSVLERLFQASWPKGPPRVLLLTAEASRLPGLTTALQDHMDDWDEPVEEEKSKDDEEDFGLGLLNEEEDESAADTVVILAPEAAARGAHAVAAHFQRGGLGKRHLEVAAPLPLPQSPEAGPARVLFQGTETLITGRAFLIGRHSDCNLIFDRTRFPRVAPHHCAILFDLATFVLRDMSKEGTWLNDQPVHDRVVLHAGDWIRLGPEGPVLRFLGQAEPKRSAASF
jgi:hypothetical protein